MRKSVFVDTNHVALSLKLSQRIRINAYVKNIIKETLPLNYVCVIALSAVKKINMQNSKIRNVNVFQIINLTRIHFVLVPTENVVNQTSNLLMALVNVLNTINLIELKINAFVKIKNVVENMKYLQ